MARKQLKKSKGKQQQRQSFSAVGIGPGNQRTSALFDAMLEGWPSCLQSYRLEFFDLPDILPLASLASLPGMPPSPRSAAEYGLSHSPCLFFTWLLLCR